VSFPPIKRVNFVVVSFTVYILHGIFCTAPFTELDLLNRTCFIEIMESTLVVLSGNPAFVFENAILNMQVLTSIAWNLLNSNLNNKNTTH